MPELGISACSKTITQAGIRCRTEARCRSHAATAAATSGTSNSLTNYRADTSRQLLVLGEAPASAFQRFNHSAMKKCPSALHYLLLLTLSTLATAFAQGPAPSWNLRTARPLEKYDDPPRYIYRLETSPRMISPHGVFISYQVNVDANGNNIVGDAANECSISVDPTNTSKMAIGWRQFDSVLSNFRQGGWGYTRSHSLY